MVEIDQNAVKGAETVIHRWACVQPGENICIVTGKSHVEEAQLMKRFSDEAGAVTTVLEVADEGIHVGEFFDENEDILLPYDIIIGASEYSIITTKAADQAIRHGRKLLSLPLSTNNGKKHAFV